MYSPGGGIIGTPQVFADVIGSTNGPSSFLVHGQRVAGAFSPRGVTWNAAAGARFAKLLHLRAVYTDNRSVGLIVLHADMLGDVNENVLDGSGDSRYRQGELTAKVAWKDNQQLVFSYVSSRAEGNQNIFDNFVRATPNPFIRPTSYAGLPGDLPNRFLMWGHVKIPFERFEILNPTVEYRNGFPYTSFDAMQNYVGVPNSDRFPKFLSADAHACCATSKLSGNHVIRLSVTGYSLTNRFNALAIHGNVGGSAVPALSYRKLPPAVPGSISKSECSLATARPPRVLNL